MSNLFGSWIDEFCKIAEEKGWTEGFSPNQKVSTAEEFQTNSAGYTPEPYLSLDWKKNIWDIWSSLKSEQKDKFFTDWQVKEMTGEGRSNLVDVLESKFEDKLFEEFKKNYQDEADTRINKQKMISEKVYAPQNEISKRQRYEENSQIEDLQKALNKLLGLSLVPDGKFGPKTATAWNEYVAKYPTIGNKPINMNNIQVPPYDQIAKIIAVHRFKNAASTDQQKTTNKGQGPDYFPYQPIQDDEKLWSSWKRIPLVGKQNFFKDYLKRNYNEAWELLDGGKKALLEWIKTVPRYAEIINMTDWLEKEDGLDVDVNEDLSLPNRKKPYYQHSELYKDLQKSLTKFTGINLIPDGDFGPKTVEAWNTFTKKYPNFGLSILNPKNITIPTEDEIRKVVGLGKMKPELQKQYLGIKTNPKTSPNTLLVCDDDIFNKQAEIQDIDLSKYMKGPSEVTTTEEPKDIIPSIPAKPVQKPVQKPIVQPTNKPTEYTNLSQQQQTEVRRLVQFYEGKGLNREQSMQKAIQIVQNKPQKEWWEDFDANKFMEDIVNKTNEKMQGKQEVQIPHADDIATASNVIKELAKLANNLEDIGEENVAIAIDKQIRIYKTAVDKIYNITSETGEQLINKAHPSGGLIIIPANEEGGKVETIVEQQKKDLKEVDKKPTGKYAEVMFKLIATANRLEDKGDIKAARIVDKTIAELQELYPFVNRSLVSKATNSNDFNALNKIAKYDEFISIWDNLINGPFIEVRNSISGFGRSPIEYVQKKYETASALVEEIGTSWPHISLNILSKNIFNLAKVIDFGDKTFSIFNSIFFSSEKANYIVRKQESLVNGLYKLSEDMNKKSKLGQTETEQSKLEQPKTQQPKRKTNDFKQIQIDNYIEQLDRLNKIILDNAKNIHKVIKDPNSIITWIKNKKYNITNYKSDFAYDPGGKDVEKLTNFNNSLEANLKLSKLKTSSLKKADDRAIPPGVFEDNEPAKPSAKPSAKPGYRKSIKDPEVLGLQNALKGAGFEEYLGPRKVDGFWGPYTANAWNKFLEKAPFDINKTMKRINNPATQRQKDKPTNIAQVTQLIEQMNRTNKEEGTSHISLTGVDIPIGVLQNTRTFVEYMVNNHNLRHFYPSSALQYLDELSNYINKNADTIESKSQGTVDEWQTYINHLITDFKTLLKDEELLKQAGKPYFYYWEQGVRQPGQSGQQGVDQYGQPRQQGYNQSGQPGQPGQQGFNSPWSNYQGPGSKHIGVQGLFYPEEIKTIENLTASINLLPEPSILSDPDTFKAWAIGAMQKFPGADKLTDVQKVYKYFDLLKKRIYQIFYALNSMGAELQARIPEIYKEMIRSTAAFNKSLLNIGEQLGYKV